MLHEHERAEDPGHLLVLYTAVHRAPVWLSALGCFAMPERESPNERRYLYDKMSLQCGDRYDTLYLIHSMTIV